MLEEDQKLKDVLGEDQKLPDVLIEQIATGQLAAARQTIKSLGRSLTDEEWQQLAGSLNSESLLF